MRGAYLPCACLLRNQGTGQTSKPKDSGGGKIAIFLYTYAQQSQNPALPLSYPAAIRSKQSYTISYITKR